MKKQFIPAQPDSWLVIEDMSPDGGGIVTPIIVIGWMYDEKTGIGDLLTIDPLTGELLRSDTGERRLFHIRVGYDHANALAQLCTRSS